MKQGLLKFRNLNYSAMKMVRKLILTVTIICGFISVWNQASATHAAAMDISYTCVDDSLNLYEFQVDFYRPCSGIAAPASIVLDLNSTSCGITTSLNLTLVSTTKASDYCPSDTTDCQGGSSYAYDKNTYLDTIILAQCSDWVFSWDLCCRNGAVIDHITGSPALYVEDRLDNSAMCNSSVVDTFTSTKRFCVGQPYRFNMAYFDPDGDSLVYSLVPALQNATTNVSYTPTYSATSPIDTNGGGYLTFDPVTGILEGICYSAGGYSVALKIDEYRNGTWIASTHAESFLEFKACTNSAPDITNVTNLQGGVLLDSNVIQICGGDSVSFIIISNDSDTSDTLSMFSNVFKSIPNATFTVTGINPVTGTFSWQTSAADSNHYSLGIKTIDNNCNVLGSTHSNVIIRSGATLPAANFSHTGSGLQIFFDGNSDFAGGISCDFGDSNTDTVPNPTHTYAASGTYTVCYSFINSCGTDTICKNIDVCNVVAQFTPTNITICPGDTVSFTNTGTGATSYQWLEDNVLFSTATNPSRVFPTVGTFIIKLNASDSACTDSFKTTITVTSSNAAFSYGINGYIVSFIDASQNANCWFWDFDDGITSSISNPAHIFTNKGFYDVCLIICGPCANDTFCQTVIIDTTKVWPGDANSDLIANNLDVLTIGITFNDTGPVRPSATNVWIGQPAPNWPDTLSTGVNHKHSDCDGNGEVNALDVSVVGMNYGMTHLKTSGISHGADIDPPLYPEFQQDSAVAGTKLILPLNFGTAALPAKGIYGLAFTLHYDHLLIDSDSITLSFNNSWLGSTSTTIDFTKNFFPSDKMDVAHVRNDQQNESDFGQIGLLEIIVTDNIDGLGVDTDTLILAFSNIMVIDSAGNIIQVNPISDSIILFDKPSSIGPNAPIGDLIKVFPNPANDIINIEVEHLTLYEVKVMNILGQVVYRQNLFEGNDLQLDTRNLFTGMYFISFDTDAGSTVKKISIVHNSQ